MLHDSLNNTTQYDHVIIATHANQSLSLLDDPSDLEINLLGSFRYTKNKTFLHSDPSLMPKNKSVWSSWNYVSPKHYLERGKVSVTYWMNRLQNINEENPIFVTLNPFKEIKECLIKKVISYSHPLYNLSSIKAQKNLWKILYYNGKQSLIDLIYFEIFKSKKINKKLIHLLDFFKDKEVPIFPIKAKNLIEKFDISEGKLLGIKLKKIEEKWINNDFKVSEKEVFQVVES